MAKRGHIDKLDIIEGPEVDSHIYHGFIFNKL